LASWIFTILIFGILGRAYYLRTLRTNPEPNQATPPSTQLAILKECLFQSDDLTRAEHALQDLKAFCKNHKLKAPNPELIVSIQKRYHNLLALKQSPDSDKSEFLKQDAEICEEEFLWLDKIPPLEFSQVDQQSDPADKLRLWTLGITRLYADENILNAIHALKTTDFSPDAKAITELLSSFDTFTSHRDQCGIQPQDIEALQKLNQDFLKQLNSLKISDGSV
jgi:hypothetical protein